MKLIKMESIPAKSNPFNHDYISMGTVIASNLVIMHMNHHDQELRESYLVNTDTGERYKLEL